LEFSRISGTYLKNIPPADWNIFEIGSILNQFEAFLSGLIPTNEVGGEKINQRNIMSSYLNLKKTKEKDGEIEWSAEVVPELIAKKEEEVLAEAGADFEMPGFRKGKVPEQIVRERISPINLLEEAAEKAIPQAVREIVTDEKTAFLGRPEIAITKLAPGNPIAFTVKLALVPEVGLPDYKKIAQTIAKKGIPAEVSEQELNDAITHLREMLKDPEKKDELPELTDEFVKQLGPYKNVAEFTEDLKKNLLDGKTLDLKGKQRDEMVKEITEKAKVKVPHLILDQELDGFLTTRDEELKKAGITLEDYLKQIEKTEEELEKEERTAIEKQIAMSLVMGEIRKQEKITASDDEIKKNVSALRHRYPDRTEAELWESAEAIAIQKKFFDILEGTSEPETT
jgi:FKBP-type peptidyl-prolyl cis-trans isomerase (trigger factor)